MPDLDAVGSQYVVGVHLAGGGRIGHADGCQLVPEQGGRRRSRGPLPGTRAPSCTIPIPPVSSDAGHGLDRRPRVGLDRGSGRT